MLNIVENGQPACTIIVPKNSDTWTTRAAEWLQEYVCKSTGAELKIASEEQTPSGTLISVGHTKLAQKAGINVTDLKWDGCKLVARENVLYLIGRDRTKEIADTPHFGPRGTARATVTFLEDFGGVRWFLPTPQGELVPKKRDLSVPSNLDKTVVPAFAYAAGRYAYGQGTPASLANNFRASIAVRAGGEIYYEVVPAKKYFKDHPEYFAVIKGKRTGEGNHLCSTNPDVKRLLVEWIRARFDEGYDWVSVGQEDGYRRCECPECEKLDDYRYESTGLGWDDFMYGSLRKTPCERLFILHKAVIDEVRKSHPDKKALLMCYAPTAWPSKKISYFGDNVIGELMNQEPEFVQAWQGKITGKTGYVYWFNIQLPMGMDVHATPKEVAEKIRYLHKNGFVGLYQFQETNWGLQGPIFYTLGKLMGNPDLDPKPLVQEYCQGVYEKAGKTMVEFFDILYARHEEVLPQAVEDFSGRANKIPPWLTTTELYLMKYPPRLLSRLDQLLQKAENEADTERSRGWLRLTRDHFDFTILLTHALISYRAYQSNPTTGNWRELREQVDAFDDFRMKIITYSDEYVQNWFPGHDHFCSYLTADAQHESKTYYVGWPNLKAGVLAKGVKGSAIGYGGVFGYSFVKEPLTLDFSKE